MDAFAQYYTPTVVLLAFLLAVTPPLLYGAGTPPKDWLKKRIPQDTL